jgi:hypothetical protein
MMTANELRAAQEAALSPATLEAARMAADLNTKYFAAGTPPLDNAPWTVDDVIHVAVSRYLGELERRYEKQEQAPPLESLEAMLAERPIRVETDAGGKPTALVLLPSWMREDQP